MNYEICGARVCRTPKSCVGNCLSASCSHICCIGIEQSFLSFNASKFVLICSSSVWHLFDNHFLIWKPPAMLWLYMYMYTNTVFLKLDLFCFDVMKEVYPLPLPLARQCAKRSQRIGLMPIQTLAAANLNDAFLSADI